MNGPTAPTDPPVFTEKDQLDYAWKHFALIADQRVKTFNLYLLVLLAAFGATVSSLGASYPRPVYSLIGLVHTFCLPGCSGSSKRGVCVF